MSLTYLALNFGKQMTKRNVSREGLGTHCKTEWLEAYVCTTAEKKKEYKKAHSSRIEITNCTLQYGTVNWPLRMTYANKKRVKKKRAFSYIVSHMRECGTDDESGTQENLWNLVKKLFLLVLCEYVSFTDVYFCIRNMGRHFPHKTASIAVYSYIVLRSWLISFRYYQHERVNVKRSIRNSKINWK